MAYAGKVIESPDTRLIFRQTAADTDGKLLRFEQFIQKDHAPVPAHAHPRQEERFVVLSGDMGVRAVLRARSGSTAPERRRWCWMSAFVGFPLSGLLSPTVVGSVKGAITAALAGKVRVTAGRASDFFGPRVMDSAAGETVFGRAVFGKSAQVGGDPDLFHTYTYAPDIGKGLVTLGEREETLGRAWHLPGPETVSTRRFVEMIFEETGGKLKLQRAPRVLFRVLGLFNPAMREMLYEFEEPFLVDHSAFAETFGNHATPLREAIRETVRWYRERSALN